MAAPRPLDVLVLYMHTTALPMRPTQASHLRFLERGSQRHQVLYWNLVRSCPPFVRRHRYDVVLLHYSVLAARWTPRFARIRQALEWLPRSGALVVAMPQDEYDGAHDLDDWLVDVDARVVFSIFSGPELDALYPRTRGHARFEQCLTGYVDQADLARAPVRAAAPHHRRPNDIAYRAGHLPYRFGSHGQLKHRVAEAFANAARKRDLRADISTSDRSVLMGDAWFALLASARCVLGTESGASAMDPRGEIRERERALRTADPGLTLEAFAAMLPPGWDDHRFFAISPRHFEAAMVGACQVLVEGAYDGILEPETHYLPVRRDLSDVGEVCERLADRELTARVAERAQADLVASGRYTYDAFARRVEDVVAPLVPPGARARPRPLVRVASRAHDRLAVRAPRELAAWGYATTARRAPGVLRFARSTLDRVR